LLSRVFLETRGDTHTEEEDFLDEIFLRHKIQNMCHKIQNMCSVCDLVPKTKIPFGNKKSVVQKNLKTLFRGFAFSSVAIFLLTTITTALLLYVVVAPPLLK
jgi:hypothetical protein